MTIYVSFKFKIHQMMHHPERFTDVFFLVISPGERPPHWPTCDGISDSGCRSIDQGVQKTLQGSSEDTPQPWHDQFQLRTGEVDPKTNRERLTPRGSAYLLNIIIKHRK